MGSYLAYIVASHKPQTRQQQIQISSAAVINQAGA
jgi:hypothetical protein